MKGILNKIVLKGIPGIKKAIMTKNNKHVVNIDDNYVSKPQWVIDTDGSSLQELLNHPNVDFTKTISNDIQEIYHLLGIEAAREAIIFELTEVINDAGSYVNQRHISFADIMTSRGR